MYQNPEAKRSTSLEGLWRKYMQQGTVGSVPSSASVTSSSSASGNHHSQDVQKTETTTQHTSNGEVKQNLTQTDKVITSLLAGATAGGVAKTIIAPFDMTKIYFQTHNVRFTFGGMWQHIFRVAGEHGFRHLWHGNTATLVRILPYSSIQYASHEQFKHILHLDTFAQKKAHPERSFLAGSLAGIVSTSATYPLDLARARMAVNHQYSNVLHVFVDMFKSEGVISIYRGYWPTLLGIIPYAGSTFFTYETCKRYHHEYFGGHELHPLERLCFGALAGVIGQTASYPLDIVRRRMQTRSGDRYRTARGTIAHVLKTEGFFKGFYKGLTLNFIKGPIAVGISFTVFDLLQRHLHLLAHESNQAREASEKSSSKSV